MNLSTVHNTYCHIFVNIGYSLYQDILSQYKTPFLNTIYNIQQVLSIIYHIAEELHYMLCNKLISIFLYHAIVISQNLYGDTHFTMSTPHEVTATWEVKRKNLSFIYFLLFPSCTLDLISQLNSSNIQQFPYIAFVSSKQF